MTEVGVHQLLAGRTGRTAVRFDGNEDRTDFVEDRRIVKAQHPAFLGGVIDVENAEIDGGSRGPGNLAPSLERVLGIQNLGILEIEGVEDQGLPLGVEDAAERALPFTLLRPAGTQ